MITCTVDASAALESLTVFQREQLPYATARALTRLASTAQLRVQEVMLRVFDRPTPATIKGVLYRPANKSKLEDGATVYILNEGGGKSLSPAKWLNAEVDGGQRRDKRLEVALRAKGILPSGAQTAVSRFAPLDVYGNLKGSFVVQLMSILNLLAETGYAANQTAKSKARNAKRVKKAPDYFVGRPEGGHQRTGIWERIDTGFGSAIRPILYFIKAPTYKPRLPFSSTVDGVVKDQGVREMQDSLADAIRKAFPK